MKETLLDCLEFSMILNTFDSEIEKSEIRTIKNSTTTVLDLYTFCEERVSHFVNLLSTVNPILSEYKKDILKEKVEVYIAFLEEIYRIDKIEIKDRMFYDETHADYLSEFKDIFPIRIFEKFS